MMPQIKRAIVPTLCFLPGSFAISTVVCRRWLQGEISPLDGTVVYVATIFILVGMIVYVTDEISDTVRR
jgi:hypothetical protein